MAFMEPDMLLNYLFFAKKVASLLAVFLRAAKFYLNVNVVTERG